MNSRGTTKVLGSFVSLGKPYDETPVTISTISESEPDPFDQSNTCQSEEIPIGYAHTLVLEDS